MLSNLDVTLYVRHIDDQKLLVAIKRKDDLLWSHFESKHWPLEEHPLYLQCYLKRF